MFLIIFQFLSIDRYFLAIRQPIEIIAHKSINIIIDLFERKNLEEEFILLKKILKLILNYKNLDK